MRSIHGWSGLDLDSVKPFGNGCASGRRVQPEQMWKPRRFNSASNPPVAHPDINNPRIREQMRRQHIADFFETFLVGLPNSPPRWFYSYLDIWA